MDNLDNIQIYIQNKHKEYIKEDDFDNRKYKHFYQNISPIELANIFECFHVNLNALFSFLNQKKNINNHYNADASRELIDLISNIESFQQELSNSKYSFIIKSEYKNYIQECKEFLVYSGGSTIPDELELLQPFETQPIFKIESSISINRENITLKPIGEGSYATVSKYKDKTYDKFFAIKKAKPNLSEKELIRFKNEFECMKKLNSPYVLEVYRFDENKQSYLMEYADITLEKYIEQNNNKISMKQRVNFINQILKAFEYINQVIGYHRDISTTNILLKKHDDLWVVKVSDFGLVKEKHSNLTSFNTEFKGSLNDPKLDIVGGFKNYTGHHETYALTRLIYFILTGRRRIDKFKNMQLKNFIENGMSDNLNVRYKDVTAMKVEFQKILKFLK